MAQKLYLGGEQLIAVERIFRDEGQREVLTQMNGQVVQLAAPRSPLPSILQSGEGFFYEDYSPVGPLDVLEHVPPVYRERIRAWAGRMQGQTPRPVFLPTERQRRAAAELAAAGTANEDPEVALWRRSRPLLPGVKDEDEESVPE